jgi:acyl carrier protein
MKNEKKFKEFLAQYCTVKPQDMTDDMRFLEDLGLSSFDFMSLLGDLEDNFDVELDPENIGNVTTIGQALALIGDTRKSA